MYDGEKHLVVDEDIHTAVGIVAKRLKIDMKALAKEALMLNDDIKKEVKLIVKAKEKRK